MNHIEDVLYNLTNFDFTGAWWQYLIALVFLVIALGLVYAIFEELPSGILYLIAIGLAVIGAFALVELVQSGLALWRAALDVVTVSSLLCVPLFYSANEKEEAET